MKKRFLHILISLSLAAQCFAPHAAMAGAPARRPLTDIEILQRTNANYSREVYSRYARRQISRMKTKVVAGSKTAARVTAKQAGHQLQTIVLISILTIAEIVRENKKIAGITGQPATVRHMTQDFSEAANLMFNSPEYWSSVTGAFAMGPAAAGVSGMVEKLFANVSSRNIFKNLATAGASTLVTFLGWEFFGELVLEAREMIEDDRDYERSRNFGRMLKGYFGSASGRQSFEDRENKRVMGLLFKNMGLILFHSPELRAILVSNTWRNRIATGHFATLVGFMAAGGTAGAMAGTVLFPGAGTVVGIAFGFLGGLVGGIATLVIPESTKNSMTAFFRDLRKGFWNLFDDRGGFTNVKETYFSILYECMSKNKPCPPVLLENVRNFGRAVSTDNYITVMFEEFMFYEKEIAKNRDYMALAQAARNREKFKIYSEHVREASDAYKRKLIELDQKTYRLELNQMYALFKKYPIKQEWTRRYPQLQGLFNYYRTVKVMTRGLEAYSRVSREQMHSDQKLFLPTLYQIYFMGFSKRLFLESVTTQVRQVANR